MKLKEEIVDRIRSRRRLRVAVCNEVDITREALWRYLNLNSENGKLTVYPVLKIVSQELNQPIDELLTADVSQEVA